MTTASVFTDFWNRLERHDEMALFLVFLGFILSFAFIRMSTRLMRSPRVPWWPGSVVSEGGLHIHHLVFGIIAMMAAGTLGFAAAGNSPWAEICAAVFGVGVGLTIDEFALWVHLDDVYWSREGRSSIDATVIAAAAMMLILLGFTPFTVDTSSAGEVVFSLAGVIVLFLVVAISFAKQRYMHGIVGFFVFPIAVYGASRIGKPRSPWARRFYGERRPAKQAKSEARFHPGRRTDRFKEAFRDIVGGKPSEGLTAARDEALAATREAGEEMRERAKGRAG
jgi:hypothetical protein